MSHESTNRAGGRRVFLLAVTAVLLFAFGWILASDAPQAQAAEQQSTASGEADTVATIGDESIDEQEVLAAAPMKLRKQHHQLVQQAVDAYLADRLLEREAEARGMTASELAEQEIASQTGEVTDADVSAFYTNLEQQRGGQVPPQEQVEGQIRGYLEQQEQQQARQAYLDTLKEKYAVEVSLTEPKVEIATEGYPAKGPKDAPVTIVEFSDFECPYCSRVNPTLEKVEENYGDQVRLVFRQFPLDIHPNAQKAAEASLCAQDQEKFWAMHDAMFADQKNLAVADLKTKAEEVGLDTEEFNQCLESGEYADEVRADLEAGQQAGVSGTPALFINGRMLSGAQPYETIAGIIDEELAEQEGSG